MSRKTIISFALVATYLLIMAFSVLLTATFEHDMRGMDDCLHMMAGSSLCPLNITGYLTTWKEASGLSLRVLLVLTATIIVLSFFFPVAQSAMVARRSYLRWRTALLRVFQPLFFAFSRGILHPKIFDTVSN